MTERMDAEPGQPETSPELDLTTLPWLVPDDPAPDEITPAPSERPKPPPRRTLSPRESATIVGGAVAGAAATSPALPRRIVTTPKRRATTSAEALPSVLIPNATLPPRGRGDDAGGELAAPPLADDDRGHRRVRPTRALIALGALTLAGLAAAGAARLRGRDDSPLPYSPPAFVNEAPPSDPPPPPVPDTTPSVAAPGSAPSSEAAAPHAAAAPPPPPPATGELVPPDMSNPTAPPSPSAPPVADTPPAAHVSSAPVPAAVTPQPPPEHGAAGKMNDAEVSRARPAPTTTRESTSPRPRHGRRRELAAPQASPVAPSRPLRTSGSVDPITTYTFASDELFRVQAAPKRVTDLILQPGEKLATRPMVGDASLWIIHVVDAVHGDEPQQHVQVTPLRVDTTTNLTLTTNRRNYHLELSAGSGAYMAAVQWRYPEHDAERRRQELERLTRERQSSTRVADAKALRFDYSIRNTSGKPSWRPTMVFDDGSQTFIRFPGGVCPDPLPMLFVVRSGSTQNAEYVNYRVRGDLYVVDRVVDAVELRLPSKDADEAQQVVLIQRSAH